MNNKAQAAIPFAGFLSLAVTASAIGLEIASFDIDVTPPVGAPLCDALVPPAVDVADPLRARGVLIVPAEQQPIVLLAVDWVGIGNAGHDAWRQALATAVGTDVGRVAVHALHQHDAPGCDFLAERIAADVDLAGQLFDVEFARRAGPVCQLCIWKTLRHELHWEPEGGSVTQSVIEWLDTRTRKPEAKS